MQQNERDETVRQILGKLAATYETSPDIMEAEYREFAPEVDFDGKPHVMVDLRYDQFTGMYRLRYRREGSKDRIYRTDAKEMSDEMVGCYECELECATDDQLQTILQAQNIAEALQEFRRSR